MVLQNPVLHFPVLHFPKYWSCKFCSCFFRSSIFSAPTVCRSNNGVAPGTAASSVNYCRGISHHIRLQWGSYFYFYFQTRSCHKGRGTILEKGEEPTAESWGGCWRLTDRQESAWKSRRGRERVAYLPTQPTSIGRRANRMLNHTQHMLPLKSAIECVCGLLHGQHYFWHKPGRGQLQWWPSGDFPGEAGPPLPPPPLPRPLLAVCGNLFVGL